MHGTWSPSLNCNLSMEPPECCDITSGGGIKKRHRCLLLNVISGELVVTAVVNLRMCRMQASNLFNKYTCAFEGQSYLARCTCCQICVGKNVNYSLLGNIIQKCNKYSLIVITDCRMSHRSSLPNLLFVEMLE